MLNASSPVPDPRMTESCDIRTGRTGRRCYIMPQNYQGLPAAATVEQAIVLAQLLILRDLERRTQSVPTSAQRKDRAA